MHLQLGLEFFAVAGFAPGTLSIFEHGINSVVLMVDLFVAVRPYRLLHVFQPIAILVMYAVFSVIYWAAGGVDYEGNHYIYDILDWDKPDSALIFLAGGLVAMFPLHAIIWSIHLLRDHVRRRTVKQSNANGSSGLSQATGHDNQAMDSKVESIEMT